MLPLRSASRKHQLNNGPGTSVADPIGGASHYIAISSSSAKVAASVAVFCAALLLYMYLEVRMTEFDSANTNLRGFQSINRRADILQFSEILLRMEKKFHRPKKTSQQMTRKEDDDD